MNPESKTISKFLSLVLRHKPEQINLSLDEQGWANVQDLIEKMNIAGTALDLELLEHIVASNEKKRFAFSDDKKMIRASQGHSIGVDLQLLEAIPPDILYHGTTGKYVDSILQTGLNSQKRQHVHLSATKDTAVQVGSRHGKPVVLEIKAGIMYAEGYKFYLSANHVWLALEIPAPFLTVCNSLQT